MVTDIFMAALSLAIILVACTFFTNAVEWFGKRLNLGQGVVGSILAAIGTALPETLIPIIAIMGYSDANSTDIGIGAIAGAPFMLCTLGFFITGVSVIIYSLLGKRSLKMNVDMKIVSRDFSFFLVVYSIAIATTFVAHIHMVKEIVAVFLLLAYAYYVKLTFAYKGETHDEELDDLFLAKVMKTEPTLPLIIVQMLLALGGIIFGAHLFIEYVELLSEMLGVAPLIFSIIVTPIATELPEKINSIIWTGKKKDTLALGNITGAFVFQSCFPVAFGLAFTEWKLTGVTLASALMAIMSVLLNWTWVKTQKTVNPFILASGAIFYIGFLVYTFA